MTDRAQQFRSRKEVEARERFDIQCGIALADFASLVGAYVFPEAEQVECQLVKDGNVCHQKHWHGWVARNKDGAEGYIGRDCAAANFGADRTFVGERARVQREFRIDDLVARLATYLGDRVLASRIGEAIDRQRSLRAEVARIRDLWPDAVRRRLQDMAKTGNRRVVAEFQYIETDEDGKKHRQWVPSTIATVVGVDAFDSNRMRDIGDRLRAAQEACQEAQASRDQPERALRGWVDAIGEVERCEVDLDEIQGALDSFMQPDNLRAVSWTSSNDQVQETSTAVAITLATGCPPTSAETHATRMQWAAEIRATNAGREFRIAG